MGSHGTCVGFEDSSLRPSEMRLTPEPGKTLHVGPLQLGKPSSTHSTPGRCYTLLPTTTHRLGTQEAVTVAWPALSVLSPGQAGIREKPPGAACDPPP